MDLKLAQTMATDLMKYYNLDGWSFAFDRSLTRLGLCSHRRKMISLSKHVTSVNSAEEVLNTICHEIAHALVGAGLGHGSTWRQKAIELGCNGNRCGKISVKAEGKYTIRCACGYTHTWYRKPVRYIRSIANLYCNICGKEKSKGKLVIENCVTKEVIGVKGVC